MRGPGGKRLRFVLTVTLFLLAIAPGAQAAPVAPEWSSSAEATVGSGSCIPSPEFACSGLNGDVGNTSCIGSNACRLQVGNVGNGSCLGTSACDAHTGNVGNNSCSGASACAGVVGSVGSWSCNVDSICAGHIGDIGDCEFNAGTPGACLPPPPLPDARIKRPGGVMKGNNIYNANAVNQSINLSIYDGNSRRIYITGQNDGLQADSYRVQISEPLGLQPGITIRWFKGRTNTEITTAIEDGTYTTPVIQPGDFFRIRARISVTAEAAVHQADQRAVTVTSMSDSFMVDVVGFTVERLSLDPCEGFASAC